MKVYIVMGVVGYECIPTIDNVFLSKENAEQYKYEHKQDMRILEREVYDAGI